MDQIKALKGIQPATEATPEVEEEPQLGPDELWVWDAFVTLNAQRSNNDSGHPLPITLSDYAGYSQVAAWSSPDAMAALPMIQGLDKVYLDHRFQQIEEAEKRAREREQLRQTMGVARRGR